MISISGVVTNPLGSESCERKGFGLMEGIDCRIRTTWEEMKKEHAKYHESSISRVDRIVQLPGLNRRKHL
jgi:hypothetical protein